MGRLAKLERHALSKLGTLSLEFPVFTWETTDDPFKLNAIFSPRDWELDSPVNIFTEDRQDWIHWFLCDPSKEDYLEIYFERFQGQVATVWARLRVDGHLRILNKNWYKDNSDGHAYSAGGVRLECCAPMRGWRLALNAEMEEPVTGHKVHVRVGAQVAMVGHTFELPKQAGPSFLARRFGGIENLETAKAEISKCCGECQAISQPVSAFAEISIDGRRQDLMLFGSRLKFFGVSDLLGNVEIDVGYAENGTTFTAIHADQNAFGYCCNPRHHVQPLVKTRWHSPNEGEKPPHLRLNFEAGGCKYKLDLGQLAEEARSEIAHGSLLVGKETSRSVRLTRTVLKRPDRVHPPEEKLQRCQLLQFPQEQNDCLLLTTSDAACKNPKLTGGKGSSLAVLTCVAENLRTFTVPSAVVVTVNAYAKFAAEPEVSGAIKEFIESSRMADMTALKTASDKCVSAISDAALPELIRKSLMDKLHESFGPSWDLKKFAVRSSAIGEDSEEMSAAGQMTTYLGLRGEQAISSAVVKCWASQFALTAVNYKRQYGQPLNSSMAVVVQEMVSADCAGVMFTCDPVTSNPSGIFITANFGLGESVVSATADPDTYSLRRIGSRVVLESKACGVKDSMVVESEDGTGTEEMSIESDKKQTFCLSDERAIEIASIGAALADITDSPRDIEWAVVRGDVHLLQSRPVTSFLRESDFEIRHDMNSGFYTNREILSRGNLDEVMPGVFSTLGASMVGQMIFETFNKKNIDWGNADLSQFTHLQTASSGKKVFMSLSQNGIANNKKLLKYTAASIFGYDISDHQALKEGIVHEAGGTRGWGVFFKILGSLRDPEPIMNAVRRGAEDLLSDPPHGEDGLSLFLNVIKQVPRWNPLMDGFTSSTTASGLYSLQTLNAVKSSQGANDLSPELMVLLSKLLRSDLEVESAQIPKELTALSNMLRDDANAGRFVQWTPEEALGWLETDDGEAAKQFRVLRSKHAHRCYKEFDIQSRTWDIDPIPLVQTLQSMARCPEPDNKKSDDSPMTVDQLPKRPSLFQRALLKFLIPRAQKAVYAREAAKSVLIKSIHAIRLAIRRVGLELHAEGRLPDPELIFFLSCDEVYRLITTRDPSLLPRALRRQKMHPVLDQERFPVLLCGMPKPIDPAAVFIDPDAESMKGVPVSEGVVTGPARVILNFLTEAHLIKKGEILVTRATDTGWTPYFPLLGGVVTEIGGLLSHGAVVAREYGLPAIVGVDGATEFVKSGDIVTLDGNAGVLHRSPAFEESRVDFFPKGGDRGVAEAERGELSESTTPSRATQVQTEAITVVEVVGDSANSRTNKNSLNRKTDVSAGN